MNLIIISFTNGLSLSMVCTLCGVVFHFYYTLLFPRRLYDFWFFGRKLHQIAKAKKRTYNLWAAYRKQILSSHYNENKIHENWLKWISARTANWSPSWTDIICLVAICSLSCLFAICALIILLFFILLHSVQFALILRFNRFIWRT